MPGNSTRAVSVGSSRTVTTTRDTENSFQDAHTPATLRLRGQPRRPHRSIRWAEDVVDNEGMGKKSSKVCCIFHGPGDDPSSSSEESSSSSSSSDSHNESSDDLADGRGTKQHTGKSKRRPRDHKHDHNYNDSRNHQISSGDSGTGPIRSAASRAPRRPLSPNAYERVPKMKPGQGGTQTVTEQAR